MYYNTNRRKESPIEGGPNMSKISKSNTRHIIEDFAKEIEECQREGKPPKNAVIDFRNERTDGIERPI